MEALFITGQRIESQPRWGRILARIEPDLAVINIVSLTLFASAAWQPLHILQMVLGFPFVAFFPGYVALKAFFSEDEINLTERIALSFALSLIMVPVLVAIVAYGPFKFTVYPVISSVYLCIGGLSVLGQYSGNFSLKGRLNPRLGLTLTIGAIPFLFVILVAMGVRFFPVADLSSLPGNWGPGYYYPVYNTIQTGELFEKAPLSELITFPDRVGHYLHQKAYFLSQPSMFLAMGVTELDDFLRLNKFFPWHGALFFPLSALLLATKVWKRMGLTPSYKHSLFIFLVAAFFSARLLQDSRFMSINMVMGFSLMLLATYFAIDNRHTLKSTLLAMAFSVAIFLFYYTAGAVFLVLLVFAYLAQTVMKDRLLSGLFVLFYIVTFMSYYLYVASGIFGAFSVNLAHAILYPGAISIQRSLGRPVFEFGSIAHLSAYVNVVLTAVPIVLLVYAGWRRHIIWNVYSRFVVYLTLALINVGILLFLWRGLKGFTRIETYIPMAAIIALSLLLVSRNRRLKALSVGTGFLLVPSSIIAFAPGTAMLSMNLDVAEANAVRWSCTRSQAGDVVFTDARIGTAPMMLGCLNFTGVPGLIKRDPRQADEILDVYYGSDPAAAKTVIDQYGATHLLLSERMKTIGVSSLADIYDVSTQDGFLKYEESSLFDKIYDSGGASYFYVPP